MCTFANRKEPATAPGADRGQQGGKSRTATPPWVDPSLPSGRQAPGAHRPGNKTHANAMTYTPKPRYKIEFARMICGSSFSDKAALHWLRSEIASNPNLMSALAATGYSKNSKMLTIVQQNTILQHLNIPLS